MLLWSATGDSVLGIKSGQIREGILSRGIMSRYRLVTMASAQVEVLTTTECDHVVVMQLCLKVKHFRLCMDVYMHEVQVSLFITVTYLMPCLQCIVMLEKLSYCKVWSLWFQEHILIKCLSKLIEWLISNKLQKKYVWCDVIQNFFKLKHPAEILAGARFSWICKIWPDTRFAGNRAKIQCISSCDVGLNQTLKGVSC